MILGIQFFGVFFALVMLYLTFVNFKKTEFRRNEALLWGVMWIVFILIVLFPNSLDFLLETLSLVRTMDLLTILGFVFLIGLSFYTYGLSVRNRRKLEKVVRNVAIEKKE